MKKLLILVPCISFGGLENVAITTADILKKELNIHLVYFYKADKEQTIPSGIKSLCTNTPHGKNTLSQLITFIKRHLIIKKYKRENGFDYCLSVGKTASYTNLLTKSKERCFTSVHGYTDIPKNKITGFVDKVLFSKSDKIICVCKALKNEFYKATKVRENKLEVVYNPFDVKEIITKSREATLHLKGAPSLIMYGRMVAGKNYELGILALKELHRDNKNAVLNIIGDGEHKDYLKNMAISLKVENSVRFINATNNPYKYLSKSDIYITSSYSEGFSYTIVEAMACNTPIIAADCKTGFREALAPNTDINKVSNGIEMGEFGVLIPPSFASDTQGERHKKAQLLATAIKMLYNDKELLQRYAQNGFLKAQEYDVDVYKKNLLSLLEN